MFLKKGDFFWFCSPAFPKKIAAEKIAAQAVLRARGGPLLSAAQPAPGL